MGGILTAALSAIKASMFTPAGVLSAVGTGISVIGGLNQAGQYAQLAELNQQVGTTNAEQARGQAQYQANMIRRRNMRLMQAQRAAGGRSGATLNSFDALLLDSGIEGEMDALASLYTGEVNANAAISRGNIAAFSNQSRATTSAFNAIGTGLSGAGNLLTIGAQAQNPDIA